MKTTNTAGLKNVDTGIVSKLVLCEIPCIYLILHFVKRNTFPRHIIAKLERSWIDNYLVYGSTVFHKLCNQLKMIKHTTIANKLYFLDVRKSRSKKRKTSINLPSPTITTIIQITSRTPKTHFSPLLV